MATGTAFTPDPASALKILHLILSQGFAGSERYAAELASWQAHQKHQVMLVIPKLSADPATGACPAYDDDGFMIGLRPVYRLWNGRLDSNHRYTTRPEIRAAMEARGYVAEGFGPEAVAFCVP